MSLQSKVSARLNLRHALERNRVSPLLRLTELPVVAVVLCVPAGPYVLAKTGLHASSHAASDIAPDAMEALNKMGVYLRTLKSFPVQADITTDDVLDDGQIVQSSKRVEVSARTARLLAVPRLQNGEAP